MNLKWITVAALASSTAALSQNKSGLNLLTSKLNEMKAAPDSG